MLDATDPPLSVRQLLDEMSAVADRVHWFTTFRLSVIDKPGDLVDSPENTLAPLVATYDVLKNQVAKTDEALASLARHYGKVENSCPPDLSPYFDWLIDEAHALINENVFEDRTMLMSSTGMLLKLAKLLRQLSADPLDALEKTPAAFKEEQSKRLAAFLGSRSEWPRPVEYSFAVSHRLGLRYGEHWAFTRHLESTEVDQEADPFATSDHGFGDDSVLEFESSISRVSPVSQPDSLDIQIDHEMPDARIPLEHRSRVMTKDEAARFHNKGIRVPNPTIYLANLIKKNIITPPIGAGKQWVYDVRQFPEETRDKVK